jgi:hypothetical protein
LTFGGFAVGFAQNQNDFLRYGPACGWWLGSTYHDFFTLHPVCGLRTKPMALDLTKSTLAFFDKVESCLRSIGFAVSIMSKGSLPALLKMRSQ